MIVKMTRRGLACVAAWPSRFLRCAGSTPMRRSPRSFGILYVRLMCFALRDHGFGVPPAVATMPAFRDHVRRHFSVPCFASWLCAALLNAVTPSVAIDALEAAAAGAWRAARDWTAQLLRPGSDAGALVMTTAGDLGVRTWPLAGALVIGLDGAGVRGVRDATVLVVPELRLVTAGAAAAIPAASELAEVWHAWRLGVKETGDGPPPLKDLSLGGAGLAVPRLGDENVVWLERGRAAALARRGRTADAAAVLRGVAAQIAGDPAADAFERWNVHTALARALLAAGLHGDAVASLRAAWRASRLHAAFGRPSSTATAIDRIDEALHTGDVSRATALAEALYITPWRCDGCGDHVPRGALHWRCAEASDSGECSRLDWCVECSGGTNVSTPAPCRMHEHTLARVGVW